MKCFSKTTESVHKTNVVSAPIFGPRNSRRNLVWNEGEENCVWLYLVNFGENVAVWDGVIRMKKGRTVKIKSIS